jgi:hypothetical protein
VAADRAQPSPPVTILDIPRLVRRWVRDKVVGSVWGWLLPLACAVVCFLTLTLVPSKWFLAGKSWDIVELVLIGAFLAAIVGLFESMYVGLWRGHMPWTRAGPAILWALIWTLSMAMLGVALFAPISFRLYNAGHLPVSSGIHDAPHMADPLPTSWDFAVAYLWQLCDALPALKVTETVDWHEPVKHGTRMGLLLLAFRSLVLLPLIASLVGIWTGRRGSQDGRQQSTQEVRMPPAAPVVDDER